MEVIVQADARLLPFRGEVFDCCVTSPPYWGLRDYGAPGQLGLEPTPEEYVANMVAVFREVRRVLKPDGTLWLNLGDSFAGSWGNQGRKPERGTQRPINGPMLSVVDDERYPNRGSKTGAVPVGLKPKDLVGIPWRVAFALQADGWWLRSDIIWHKPNPMPESITDRPTKAHEYLFLLAKSARYYYDAEAIAERCAGLGATKSGNEYTDSGTRNRRSVWTVTTKPYPGAHFATFPPDLIKPCILAGSRPGGIVLDPFVGSGTTVKVARELGREGVGCDVSIAYLGEQAQVRIKTQRGFAL